MKQVNELGNESQSQPQPQFNVDELRILSDCVRLVQTCVIDPEARGIYYDCCTLVDKLERMIKEST